MPLLTATSTFGLGRRRWSSHQQCYLHHLRTLPLYTSTVLPTPSPYPPPLHNVDSCYYCFLDVQTCIYCICNVLSSMTQLTASFYLHLSMSTTSVLWPFFRDRPGEPVPEENFWTSWCKGRLTDAPLYPN